jgi:hypothetical protein
VSHRFGTESSACQTFTTDSCTTSSARAWSRATDNATRYIEALCSRTMSSMPAPGLDVVSDARRRRIVAVMGRVGG